MPKITKRTVDAAAPDESGRRYYVWDSEIKGFGLLVLPSGVKSYFYRYRTPEGRERRATIGKHGDWTPHEARGKADNLRRHVKTGRDPLGESSSLREAPTVTDLLDAYLASAKFAEKAITTQAVDRGRIERHLKPLLGRKHVHLLSGEDVRRSFVGIRTGKTAQDVKTCKRGRARVRGGEGTAKKAIALLRSIFAWGITEGLATSNPCSIVKLAADGTRTAILEDADAYGRLFATIDAMERDHRLRGPVADAIRLIALVGARRGEITGLRWEHVDLKRGLVTLPRHKTSAATGKPRVIGLPAVAQAIISRQVVSEPTDLVFKPARGEGPISLAKPWRAIREMADLPEGIGLHGLRHSLASHLAMNGAQAAEIMTALGHAQLSTAQRYVHWAQDARQALAERAASVALAGMAAAEGKPTAEVAPIKREA